MMTLITDDHNNDADKQEHDNNHPIEHLPWNAFEKHIINLELVSILMKHRLIKVLIRYTYTEYLRAKCEK